jgi:hypothetical protein
VEICKVILKLPTNGKGEMIMLDYVAVMQIRELGSVVHKIKPEVFNGENELWDGLAAYTLLKLEGEVASVDQAYKIVLDMVCKAAYDMAVNTLKGETQ